jgi:D-aminopeptidase
VTRARAEALGIEIGVLRRGPHNAITDVAGIRVGYSTVIAETPVICRTGVTALWPADVPWRHGVFAGCHSFNGNGELTGAHWLAEQGVLSTPIVITNTHSVGTARDAVGAYMTAHGSELPWTLPVAAETYDGKLHAAESFGVTRDMVFAALADASDGAIAEGNVGGGTGSICHGFKGGTGTASRIAACAGRDWTVGALVQANYGQRSRLTIAGVEVGRLPEIAAVPLPGAKDVDSGSIIVALATDAPLLPIQCQRLARRAAMGVARVGGLASNSSGDLFIAWSTANRITAGDSIHRVELLAPDAMTALFEAAIDATEEAIVNALLAAETMIGHKGCIAHAMPVEPVMRALAERRSLRAGAQ